ncbi:hypothetical protein LXL04_005209 [Taraxacum kok-saghyz]
MVIILNIQTLIQFNQKFQARVRCIRIWYIITMLDLILIKDRHMGNITNLYGQAPSINRSAGELRLYKDFTELSLPRNCEISFPNGKDDFMVFEVAIKPNDGFYRLFSNIA